MPWFKRIGILVILVAIIAYTVLFSVQNDARVPLDLLIWQWPEQRVALWLILAFVAGGLVGMAVSAVAILRLRSALRAAYKRAPSTGSLVNTAETKAVARLEADMNRVS